MFFFFFFFFKQKTAYEMVYSDWSSDVCSSDLMTGGGTRRRSAKRRVQSAGPTGGPEIGRASCRERVLYTVSISVVAVSLKKRKKKKKVKNEKSFREKQKELIERCI